jgi:hypothetical protein
MPDFCSKIVLPPSPKNKLNPIPINAKNLIWNQARLIHQISQPALERSVKRRSENKTPDGAQDWASDVNYNFHRVFLNRFQFRWLLPIVDLMVSNPCGKSKVHSFLQWIILAICTFEKRTGMAINPNSFKPNAFRTCLCLFIRGVIRLNLMQRSF